jgi:MFS family permease
MLGIVLFAIVYGGMSRAEGLPAIAILFLVYGIYAACTESIAKAWISNVCDKSELGTAIGTYTAFQSIFTLLASSIAGLIWFYLGAQALFALTAFLAMGLTLYFAFLKEK